VFFGMVHAEPVTLTINTDTDDIKVLEAIVPDAQEWIQDSFDGKLAKARHRLILEITDKNPNKLTEEQKKAELEGKTFKSRKQKEKEKRDKEREIR